MLFLFLILIIDCSMILVGLFFVTSILELFSTSCLLSTFLPTPRIPRTSPERTTRNLNVLNKLYSTFSTYYALCAIRRGVNFAWIAQEQVVRQDVRIKLNWFSVMYRRFSFKFTGKMKCRAYWNTTISTIKIRIHLRWHHKFGIIELNVPY